MALIPIFLDLGFAYSEHFRSAAWTFTLSCGATVLHHYCLGILNIYLFPALHTIGLHWVYLLFLYDLVCTINYSHPWCQYSRKANLAVTKAYIVWLDTKKGGWESYPPASLAYLSGNSRIQTALAAPPSPFPPFPSVASQLLGYIQKTMPIVSLARGWVDSLLVATNTSCRKLNCLLVYQTALWRDKYPVS